MCTHFFAPFLGRNRKKHSTCIYMGLVLFSLVHLAEFDFQPLPVVAESRLIGFLFCFFLFFFLLLSPRLRPKKKKKDAVSLSCKVFFFLITTAVPSYCMAYYHLFKWRMFAWMSVLSLTWFISLIVSMGRLPYFGAVGAWFFRPPVHTHRLISVPIVRWRNINYRRVNPGIGSCPTVRRITHCNKSSNTAGKFRLLFAAAALFLEYLQNGLNESDKTSPRVNWFLLINALFSFCKKFRISNVRRTVIIYWSWDIVFLISDFRTVNGLLK